jgi:excisionase family DNA binding protein
VNRADIQFANIVKLTSPRKPNASTNGAALRPPRLKDLIRTTLGSTTRIIFAALCEYANSRNEMWPPGTLKLVGFAWPPVQRLTPASDGGAAVTRWVVRFALSPIVSGNDSIPAKPLALENLSPLAGSYVTASPELRDELRPSVRILGRNAAHSEPAYVSAQKCSHIRNKWQPLWSDQRCSSIATPDRRTESVWIYQPCGHASSSQSKVGPSPGSPVRLSRPKMTRRVGRVPLEDTLTKDSIQTSKDACLLPGWHASSWQQVRRKLCQPRRNYLRPMLLEERFVFWMPWFLLEKLAQLEEICQTSVPNRGYLGNFPRLTNYRPGARRQTYAPSTARYITALCHGNANRGQLDSDVGHPSPIASQNGGLGARASSIKRPTCARRKEFSPDWPFPVSRMIQAFPPQVKLYRGSPVCRTRRAEGVIPNGDTCRQAESFLGAATLTIELDGQAFHRDSLSRNTQVMLNAFTPPILIQYYLVMSFTQESHQLFGLLTPEQIAIALKVSRAKVYAMLANHELPTIRIGRSLRVPANEFERWIRERTEGGRQKEVA